ncbi:uncharacterized protein LOC111370033 [Olea europaea var. sylvestris]|uniref:uncharacterized protein LOC111370033 n=1 Tax=Olea europaea var. sylvestris TaxID=158386 RepID=UPI000C1CEAB1|nr:uncharacterized protein LOC111370033 [Olea europaea var. sylvestris]
MFGHQSRRVRFEASRTLQNIHMKLGMPMKDHMLTMIAHFNVAENLGVTIDQETQVDMMLNSLSDMFSQFTVDYHLHKMNMPLTELMNDLQNVESGLKVKGSHAHTAIVSSFSSKSKGGIGKKRKRSNKKPGSNKKSKSNGTPKASVSTMVANDTGRKTALMH